jgi:hypothetical protein
VPLGILRRSDTTVKGLMLQTSPRTVSCQINLNAEILLNNSTRKFYVCTSKNSQENAMELYKQGAQGAQDMDDQYPNWD